MEKLKKIVLAIVLFYISFYVFSEILSFTHLYDEKKFVITFIFSILFVVIFFYINSMRIKKENENVSNCSSIIKQLIKLNEKYQFKKIKYTKHNIKEREYSRRSLDRVNASSIIKYNIENDICFLRTDIENALYNIDLLNEYNNEVVKIINKNSINNSKYSNKRFKKIENRVVNNIIHNKDEFIIKVKIECYYISNSGKVRDSRYGKRDFEQLVNIYNEWKKGKRYEETKRQERKIMNDDIRYNVFKRDNFTCQICGVTVNDGAKLHVDHIIPVSKGGKTVMSNLQTLCDRCNIGKSEKTNEDNDMICPKCGSKLVKRNGRYGVFIACSGYPKCRFTK